MPASVSTVEDEEATEIGEDDEADDQDGEMEIQERQTGPALSSEAKPHSVTLPTAWNSQQAISNMEIERIPKDILTASVSSVKRDILLISSRAAPGRDDTAGICCLLVHSIFLEWGAN
ncbi:uncharacterized protein BDCG_17571 [Blastomyces dermatitidis ER-3]|uniref:Uncharacterized protein n=1 Tax=Ajellomyces dermatitidis (strain ER-3 / ATCC MYA-2586) TaxID=559297 RepID=A0ABX2VZ95_AJEDR|nr:uncharacterized protein BDCG_17571 [Blastomyces dermatitidis ER-3]OAT02457.1 hypothetical protein BDCG_17571 [Blastomyces dermatitidis ER-3]